MSDTLSVIAVIFAAVGNAAIWGFAGYLYGHKNAHNELRKAMRHNRPEGH